MTWLDDGARALALASLIRSILGIEWRTGIKGSKDRSNTWRMVSPGSFHTSLPTLEELQPLTLSSRKKYITGVLSLCLHRPIKSIASPDITCY